MRRRVSTGHGGFGLRQRRRTRFRRSTLPQGMVTVLLRPFPWEVDSSLQILASLEGVALAAVHRLAAQVARNLVATCPHGSVLVLLLDAHDPVFRDVLRRSRTSVCWTASASLVLPALYVLLCLDSKKARRVRRRAQQPSRPRRSVLGPWPSLARCSDAASRSPSAAADRLRPHVAGVVVLIYHRVGGGSALEIDLDPRRVRRADGRWSRRRTACVASARRSSALDAPADRAGDRGARGRDHVRRRHGRLRRRRAARSSSGTACRATLYAATVVHRRRQSTFPDDGRPAVVGRRCATPCATGLVDVGSHTPPTPTPRPDLSGRSRRRARPFGRADRRASGRGLPLDFAYPKAVRRDSPRPRELVRDAASVPPRWRERG